MEELSPNVKKPKVPMYKYMLLRGRKKHKWTGSFLTEEDALTWHGKWGQFHKDRGHELVLVKYMGKGVPGRPKK